MEIIRTPDEIEALLNEAIVRANEPSQFSGMTYEQGVEAALNWLLRGEDDSPLD